MSDFGDKYFPTSDYYEFRNRIHDKKIKVGKSNIYRFIDNSVLAKNIVALATKAELKAEQDNIMKLEGFDSSYFCGNSF